MTGKVQETGGIRLENTFSEQRFGNAGCLQNGKLSENEGPHKNKKDKAEKNENIHENQEDIMKKLSANEVLKLKKQHEINSLP